MAPDRRLVPLSSRPGLPAHSGSASRFHSLTSTMTMTTGILAAEVVGLVGIGSAAAFSPPSPPLLAVARPLGSIAVRSRVRVRSPIALSTRSDRRSWSILESSLAEPVDTESANNETLVGRPSDSRALLGDGTIVAGLSNADGNCGDGDDPAQQLQEFLSSPAVLDPAASDATTFENSSGVAVNSLATDAAVTVTPVTPKISVTQAGNMEPTLLAVPNIGFEGPGGNGLERSSFLTMPNIVECDEQPPSGGVEGVGEKDVELDSSSFFEITDSLVQEVKSLESELELIAQMPNRGVLGEGESSPGTKDNDLENLSLFGTADSLVETVQQLELMESSELSTNFIEIEERPTKQSISEKVPSIQKILRYTIPAIGTWLCSPVLSMIDTASVGLLSGTAQQAALNPAVSVSDQGALVVAFMYTATTNLIAAAVQEDNDAAAPTQLRTTITLTTALKLALVVGTVFGVVIGASSKILLKLLIGNDALDPVVFGAALRYVRVRALGMPAAVVVGTAQSACLGMQDVRSPLYVLAAAAAVNFLGDVMLVPRASAMFGGAAGAAWATVASQYAALLFFSRWLTTKGEVGKGGGARKTSFFRKKKKIGRNDRRDAKVVDISNGIMELMGTSQEGKSRRRQFSDLLASSKLSRRIRLPSKFKSLENLQVQTATARPKKQPPKSRGFLSDSKLTLRNYLSLSNLDKATAKKFLPFVVPVTTTSIGRISGYITMSHVASSTLGTYDMAAHQIIFSIFCCLCPCVDALSQVAQSFVPAIFEARERGRERAAALRRTVGNFNKVGAAFGAVLLFLVSRIPAMGSYFTADPLVLERVNGALPGVGLFLLLNGLMCAGEGSLLGQKDLKLLRNMYTIFFFAVPACMLRLKHRALAGVQAVGVGTMWATFSIYQVIRTSIWHLRLAQLQRRTDRGVEEAYM